MQLAPQLERLPQSQWVFVVFRVFGYLAIAGLALLIPETGEHRYWLAGLLTFGVAPLAVLLTLRFGSEEYAWVDPLLDLSLAIFLVHLVPQMWIPALCIALMITLAPSVSLHPQSHRIYAGFALYLLAGMSFSGWLYGIDDWWIVIAAVAVVYPSIIFYARWQVRRTDAMRARSQLINNLHQLSGSVAHDFNNVLTGISGHTELALRALPDNSPVRKDMLEVLDGVERAGLLCRQLLSFSMQADSPQTVNLVSEIRSLARILKSVVPKNMPIVVQAATEKISVRLHRPQFQQVLMNLILNAGEAMGLSGGKIQIEVSKFTKNGAAWARVTVTDTGVGMPKEELDLIFDPLYTTKSRNFGLGLASAQRVLKEHGGNIRVRSQVSHGTTVTLDLPLTFETEARASQSPSLRWEGQAALVVDDERAVREVARRFLESLSLAVDVVEDARSAIAALKARDYDVVVLDLEMPGEDGWWCLAELRKFKPDLPVVIASGYDPRNTAMPVLTVKETLLSKPFTQERLEQALLSVADANDLNLAGVERLVE